MPQATRAIYLFFQASKSIHFALYHCHAFHLPDDSSQMYLALRRPVQVQLPAAERGRNTQATRSGWEDDIWCEDHVWIEAQFFLDHELRSKLEHILPPPAPNFLVYVSITAH